MGIVYLERNSSFKLYALVTQYLMLILFLAVGGYLFGRYVVFKTAIAGGIIATLGSICGIILFIINMIKLGKIYEKSRD